MEKDWEQYDNDEDENAWQNINESYSIVRIWKIGLSSEERKKRGIQTWGFLGRVSREGKEERKYFKTKQQALSHAKKYMRTH